LVNGGIPIGADGRVHGTFGHNPSSLRLCMFDPNLQQIPRGSGDPNDPSNWVKDMFVVEPGKVLWERDFSGIEAVLVGYFAGARNYVRLAKMDVHSFYTAYALNALDGRISTNDLPDLSWSDARLAARLAEIKKEFKHDRNSLYKHLVHGANYLQSPRGARDHIFKTTSVAFDLKLVTKVMGIYFELFPEIRSWHKDLCNRVDGTKRRHAGPDGLNEQIDPWTLGVCYARNPFGYTHRFYNVLDWEKVGPEWVSSFGEDAKRLVSFLPQSTAAAIIKQAAKKIFYDHFAVGSTLRLLIHDSILGECREDELEGCLSTSGQIMSAPIPELPLDPDWNMGTHLSILTEAKVGTSWGSMKEVH
jgi:hypothetical protein